MTPGVRNVLVNATLVAGSVLASLAAAEGAIAYALDHPEILTAPSGGETKLLALARDYYMSWDRRIVQFLPACARYDPQLSYTLKPGECMVENREHRVHYQINREGLRDDEDALVRPAVVVTGDSHALGWGVARDDALSRRLGMLLRVKTLNAAQSSYGTARELALIERLDLSAAKAIIIQYCNNDFDENQAFAATGTLGIISSQQYAAIVADHVNDTRYYPFKYLRILLSIARQTMRSRDLEPPAPEPTNAQEARAFLDVLLRHEKTLKGRAVVVTEINEPHDMEPGFIIAARELLKESRYAGLSPVVSFVDLAPVLTANDYYMLDDHMRPTGHAKAALAIGAELKRMGVF